MLHSRRCNIIIIIINPEKCNSIVPRVVITNNEEKYLLLEPTIVTTMEVEVDELWTMTVARTPSISPARGLDNTPLLNALPAALPMNTIMY